METKELIDGGKLERSREQLQVNDSNIWFESCHKFFFTEVTIAVLTRSQCSCFFLDIEGRG